MGIGGIKFRFAHWANNIKYIHSTINIPPKIPGRRRSAANISDVENERVRKSDRERERVYVCSDGRRTHGVWQFIIMAGWLTIHGWPGGFAWVHTPEELWAERAKMAQTLRSDSPGSYIYCSRRIARDGFTRFEEWRRMASGTSRATSFVELYILWRRTMM